MVLHNIHDIHAPRHVTSNPWPRTDSVRIPSATEAIALRPAQRSEAEEWPLRARNVTGRWGKPIADAPCMDYLSTFRVFFGVHVGEYSIHGANGYEPMAENAGGKVGKGT